MQVAGRVAAEHKVLYVSGEESSAQVKMRADRLGVSAENLFLINNNSTDEIAAMIKDGGYGLVIVDSIQTISLDSVSSSPGSVSQITSSSQVLSQVAKGCDSALIIVGHVTKEGAIAGPKILEHLVDVVLNIEGDRYGGFKLLRAVKNRYGSTEESGIFEMTESGLTEVLNPSSALLEQRQVSDGSVVLATLEGTRAVLVEVQTIVTKTSFGYPKRAASGYDLNRLNLLIAMMSRRTKLDLTDSDVYLNIVGGLKITEPAADLAVCMSLASAAKGMMLKKNVVVFGELGLSGELRHVPFIEKRVAEATKLGFDGAVGPDNKSKVKNYTAVKTLREALIGFLEKGL